MNIKMIKIISTMLEQVNEMSIAANIAIKEEILVAIHAQDT